MQSSHITNILRRNDCVSVHAYDHVTVSEGQGRIESGRHNLAQDCLQFAH